MDDILALGWRADDPRGRAAASDLALRLGPALGGGGAGAWTERLALDGLRLWTSDPEMPVHRLPGGVGLVAGRIFDRDGVPGLPRALSAAAPGGPLTLARRLAGAAWGSYLAVLAVGADLCVFRAPTGDAPGLAWTRPDGVAVLASDLDIVPGWLQPGGLALDWNRIARFAADAAAEIAPLMTGLESVGPGDLLDVWRGVSEPVWRPHPAAEAVSDLEAGARELVRRVEICTAALARDSRGIIVELSGGLDSAIVAGALGAAGECGRVRAWLNRYGDRPEGDERAYARAVTDRLGAVLTCTPKPFPPLVEADFAELAGSSRPQVNAVDPARDRDTAQRLAELDADLLLTGAGGDALFFQMPTPLLAREICRVHGVAAIGAPGMLALARRLNRPVWSLLRAALRPETALTPVANAVLGPAARHVPRPIHPWVAAAQGLPAARRLQIRGLAYSHTAYCRSRRTRGARQAFPLLAQPVVEWALGLPLAALAIGAQDRAFARAAFAGHLPPAIRARHGKGDLTSYFQRWAAANLPFLREHLLDGVLCAAGVLDRPVLDAILDPQVLVAENIPGDLLTAATIESWVRHWQARIPDAAPRPVA